MRRSLIFPSLFALGQIASAQIYADFTTSLGNFTCELNHTAAPKTVANFVGLATGERAWTDPATGIVRTDQPFYDGLIFHRVIKEFMNQSGSRNGLGTDGPGYVFPDETENELTHQPYVISMANSGTYTNGSQFFITAVATPWLDGLHTVFGHVTSGTSVVDTINNVATNPNNTPEEPVVIHSVSIRRVGTSAQSFDIHSQSLPEPANISLDLDVQPPQKVDAIPRSPLASGSVTEIFSTSDLASWTHTRSYHLGTGPEDASPFLIHAPMGFATSIGERAFFRFANVVHPDAMIPQSFANRNLVADWSGFSITFNFDSSGEGGTATYSGDDPPQPRQIEEVIQTESPYDVIVVIDYFGALKISTSRTSENPTHQLGNMKISQWNAGAWNFIAAGTLQLTK